MKKIIKVIVISLIAFAAVFATVVIVMGGEAGFYHINIIKMSVFAAVLVALMVYFFYHDIKSFFRK